MKETFYYFVLLIILRNALLTKSVTTIEYERFSFIFIVLFRTYCTIKNTLFLLFSLIIYVCFIVDWYWIPLTLFDDTSYYFNNLFSVILLINNINRYLRNHRKGYDNLIYKQNMALLKTGKPLHNSKSKVNKFC